MNAEFKAYIDAVAGGCCEETHRGSVGAPVTDRVSQVFAEIGEFLADISKNLGPYHCDLHPWTRVRETITECCRRHEAIGYHGLA
jgi:hypothetical protein